MSKPIVVHWFRNDLRLQDNPALFKAADHAAHCACPLLLLYCFEDQAGRPESEYTQGSASRLWLHHSLKALSQALENKLSFYKSDALALFQQLTTRYHVQAVSWNRCYAAWQQKRDARIKTWLKEKNVKVFSENGSLLWEPWTVHKEDGTPYKIFTPFYRKGCLKALPPRRPLGAPKLSHILHDTHSLSLNDLKLCPQKTWEKKLISYWMPGEEGAHERLQTFLDSGLINYKEGRNFPSKPFVSRLSPSLHFGELSPNQAFYAARLRGENANVDHFCSELGWREFSYYQLYHYPDLPQKNLKPAFDHFPWKADTDKLQAWQQGQTGIPFVDAGMRELWCTGYMHNRVRMIAASFLVKNLRISWQKGAAWFNDCLVDADLANNSASWQWVAGSGFDAAPYFRIFNPVTQALRFDPEGAYIKQWVPELHDLPPPHLFAPWQAPESVLDKAGIRLGKTYPQPLIDLAKSRQEALAAFHTLPTKTRGEG